MTRNEAVIDAPIEVVWAVLGDARRYDRFVVGARRIRRFDPDWPAEGSRLHHSIGVPHVLKDSTVVVAADPPRSLRLHAGLRPAGVAEIEFTLSPDGDDRCRVVVDEHPVAGPMAWLWNPAFAGGLWLRNEEMLRRLGRLAEQRARTMATAGPR